MIGKIPTTEREYRKKKQTSQSKKKQVKGKPVIKDQNRFFTIQKVTKKCMFGNDVDIKGKHIKKKFNNLLGQNKHSTIQKIQNVKIGPNLLCKKILPIKNFHKAIKNEKGQNTKLPIPQITKNRTVKQNHNSKSPFNICLYTQRGNYFLQLDFSDQYKNKQKRQQILTQRRQNQLNSKFKQRVNRLNDITKENRKIYCRINSQKSHYLKDDMNKSYESNMEISRRLSMSKVSQRSGRSQRSSVVGSSRCSIASNYTAKSLKRKSCNNNGLYKGILKSKNTQHKQIVKIESHNINQLKKNQLQHFATLFDNSKQTKSVRIKSRMSVRNIKSISYKENQYHIGEISKTVELKKIPKHQQNQKLPKIKYSQKINQSDQQIEQKINRAYSSKKKILSTIDENIPIPKPQIKNNKFLQKIIEQPIKPSKHIFTFGSLLR